MGKISTYLAGKLLDHVFNTEWTPPATVYLGLSRANPLDDGSGLQEVSGYAYARRAIAFNAAANRQVQQTSGISFPAATGSWGTITHWALFDASSGGNMLAHGDFGVAKVVVAGNEFAVPAGQVYVGFTYEAEVSTVLAHNLLNLAFRSVAYAKPDTYMGVATATLNIGTTGSTVVEPAEMGYARVQVNPNGGAAPAWALAASRACANADAVDIPMATGSWGTCYASFVASALTGGDILFFDNGMTDQAVSANDALQFAASAITASID